MNKIIRVRTLMSESEREHLDWAPSECSFIRAGEVSSNLSLSDSSSISDLDFGLASSISTWSSSCSVSSIISDLILLESSSFEEFSCFIDSSSSIFTTKELYNFWVTEYSAYMSERN